MISFLKELKHTAEDYADRLKFKGYYTDIHNNLDPDLHIKESLDWLKRAQDFGNDRGVSYGSKFGQGFLKSYPETTGYIIPTFLRLRAVYPDEELLERAQEMGDWESKIQMQSGAVMGGMVNDNPTPAVFNTGQVLLGWISLYEQTGKDGYYASAKKAADWLVSVQDVDGNWRKGNSRFANPESTLYNVRVAWPLALWSRITKNETYLQSAVNNGWFTLQHQNENGWFSNCCLLDKEHPLLHTLAYTMRGLLELGQVVGVDEFINAAQRTADSLIAIMDEGGFLPGKLDSSFHKASTWCCLTGSAQSSIVFSKLYNLTAMEKYKEAALMVNRYLMARHDISSSVPSIRGGMAGSWPVYGDYGKYMVLNWATKFFVDALLEYQWIEEKTVKIH